MSTRFKFVITCFFLILFTQSVFCQIEKVPWNEHYSVALPDGFDPWCGSVVGVSGPTDVVVAMAQLPNGKPIEIYYPSESIVDGQPGTVLFVAGNSDTQIIREEGRPWMHSNQVLGWGRLVAEHGLIAVAYENDGHPDDCLVMIGKWLSEHGAEFGIDHSDIGTWAASNGCAVAANAFRAGHEQFGGVVPRFGVFFYGDIPLRSDHDVSIPVFVSYAKRDAWASEDRILRFVERLQERGGEVELEVHTSGSHAFDVMGENDETSRIIDSSLAFMVAH
jgi:acetyl esterase/lipase